ncbi:hypothetical protein ACVWY3_004452 [Bradyrhizobium sp. USDA 4486]
MLFRMKSGAVVIALNCLACGLVPQPAFAITAELERTCSALTTNSFQSGGPGYPAAGSG